MLAFPLQCRSHLIHLARLQLNLLNYLPPTTADRHVTLPTLSLPPCLSTRFLIPGPQDPLAYLHEVEMISISDEQF
jgi:hypothetical protein